MQKKDKYKQYRAQVMHWNNVTERDQNYKVQKVIEGLNYKDNMDQNVIKVMKEEVMLKETKKIDT